MGNRNAIVKIKLVMGQFLWVSFIYPMLISSMSGSLGHFSTHWMLDFLQQK